MSLPKRVPMARRPEGFDPPPVIGLDLHRPSVWAFRIHVLTAVREAVERTRPHYPVMSEEQIEASGKDWADMETWPVGPRTVVLLSGCGL
ncbi:hypothetical protein ACIRBY_32290 [Streptomyces sp. NPDC096136]|uniref:hypothetical protein n=1 Tax=Streptomyces sp. NPDC096136 TaxID=3366076 RepID=UPI003812FA3D